MKSVLPLGADFAGPDLATMLSSEVPDEVGVTIVDGSDAFVFGLCRSSTSCSGARTWTAERPVIRERVRGR
jgi:hypothetical protein